MATQISYTPLSEEEMLKVATQRVAPSYDEQMSLYQQAATKKEATYKGQLEKLDPMYEQMEQSIGKQYEQKKQSIADAAMARGFGRSSYVTDVMGQNHDQQIAAWAELAKKKGQEAEALSSQIEGLYDELLSNQNRLTSAKQNKILSTIDQLREEQSSREMEVMKYNADMSMKEQQYALQREEMSAQQSYNQQKLQQDTAYREQQMQMEREQFAYQQAYNASKLAAEQAAAAAKAAASAKTSKSTGTKSSSSTKDSGIFFTGVRI